MGADHRRPRRHPRRVVLGAAAPLAYHRAGSRISRRQGGRGSLARRRQPRAGPEGSRHRRSARRPGKIRRGQRPELDSRRRLRFRLVGRTIAYFGTNLSPALLGVGYIVGLNIGVVVIAGGIISWGIAIPIYSTWFLDGNAALAAKVAGAGAAAAAGAIWSAQIRYLGVGAMLIGGIWTAFADQLVEFEPPGRRWSHARMGVTERH